ncbi:hypothetical protein Ndes2526B_g05340 [Nannochloris sp. 'desiccata']|nr:hypothetical protein KSW81_006306 [Chlorella desiccata (nom. nud.)]
MPAANLAEFEKNNAGYVASFTDGDKALPPARKTAIVACMDARMHPESALGLSIGDCHMIRNAGGRVSGDALRSLAISQQLLGTNEIYVIHHTDCGMVTFKNEDIRALLKERLGAAAGEAADVIDFLPFSELEQSVLEDVAIIKNSPLINPGVAIVGAIYDVETGKFNVVTTDETPAHA